MTGHTFRSCSAQTYSNGPLHFGLDLDRVEILLRRPDLGGKLVRDRSDFWLHDCLPFWREIAGGSVAHSCGAEPAKVSNWR